MALPIAHAHHVLWAAVVRPGLSLHGIIHKVHDPAHLPLAPVPGQGVHQDPVVQDHHDQVPMLDLMPDPKHLQKGSGSRGSGCSHSVSPEIVLLQGDDEDTVAGEEEDAGHSDDKDTLSQGTVSLLDISTSNNEDAHEAIAHKAACKSDIQYGNWRVEQICQGKEGITQHDKGVNDYSDGEKHCKAPDKIGPPVPYMEECRVFRPLDTKVNPLGLFWFYCTNPPHSNIITGLKSTASAHRMKHLLEKAKYLGLPFTIIVFECGNVTLLGLLQELHL